jgi:hypothetical protein
MGMLALRVCPTTAVHLQYFWDEALQKNIVNLPWAGTCAHFHRAPVWNTKRALIFCPCCTFSLYSFVNFPFTVFQVNILIMLSLLRAHS